MRTFMALALVASFLAAGCGSKGSGDSPVGAWTLDLDQMVEAGIPVAQAEMRKQMEGMDAEQAKMMEAMMPAADKLAEMMRAQFKDVKIEIVFAADGTFTASTKGMGKDEASTGTWTQSGPKVTATLKTKNGAPAEGEDAEPRELTMKDGKLSMQPAPEAPVFYFTRK